jgi:hypothetical protein
VCQCRVAPSSAWPASSSRARPAVTGIRSWRAASPCDGCRATAPRARPGTAHGSAGGAA